MESMTRHCRPGGGPIRPCPPADRRLTGQAGFIIHSVLVVIILTAMVAVSLMYSMHADQTAAAAGEQGEQAWATAMSGLQQAISQARQIVPGSFEWQDNPAMFQRQFVCDDGSSQWYYSVFSEGILETDSVRYGLTDEAGKYDLRRADPALLNRLLSAARTAEDSGSQWAAYTNQVFTNLVAASPELAEELANPAALLDSGSGAATNKSPAGRPAAAAAATGGSSGNSTAQLLDAVFLNSGHDIRLLYGKDVDLNFQVDAAGAGAGAEAGAGGMPAPDPGSAGMRNLLDLGLRHFLTVVAYEPNVNSQGQPRLDLNDTNADLSTLSLPSPVVAYVAAMRRENRKINHPSELLEASGKFKGDNGAGEELASGVGAAELAVLLDRCTGTNASRLDGLINLNTAPKEILALLPGVDDAVADGILAARRGLSSDQMQTTAWLVQQGLMDAEAYKKVAPLITSRSCQFHFHVVGFSTPAGRYRVLEAIVDVACNPPQILFLRDLTRLGLPFKLEASPQDQISQVRPRPRQTAALIPAGGRRVNRLSPAAKKAR